MFSDETDQKILEEMVTRNPAIQQWLVRSIIEDWLTVDAASRVVQVEDDV